MGKLDGRVAIVTGAGRGIGASIAKLMAAEGAKVVVNDLGANVDGTGAESGPADEVVAEIKAAGGEALANGDSVADHEAAENMVRQTLDEYGKLDILVNVAGILRDRMIFNMSEEEWTPSSTCILRARLTRQSSPSFTGGRTAKATTG